MGNDWMTAMVKELFAASRVLLRCSTHLTLSGA
jgi:hypothetical protein